MPFVYTCNLWSAALCDSRRRTYAVVIGKTCAWCVPVVCDAFRFTVPVELGGHVPAAGVCDAAGAGGGNIRRFLRFGRPWQQASRDVQISGLFTVLSALFVAHFHAAAVLSDLEII